jgi:hypothetical protein
MTKNKILVEYFEKGITYQELSKDLEDFIQNRDVDALSEKDKQKHQFSKLNLHRYSRIQKTYQVSDELKKMILKIKSKQNWLVLTEHWCGDSAQILPYVQKMVELNSNIKIKFFFRDENLELMDLYLTNGKQAIPKIIAFDKEGIELFQWGPRPKEVIKLFEEEKATGLSIMEILEKIHLWYGRNRGKAIEVEFGEILSKLYKNESK